ncbi:FKBP-type peptidyl-prolyl cis-trans isomerase [Demequina activiva]|uniref:peptidylprolyl isomerase n=1 Tax=Demequina activiva TaxID=1582364 RepID=A0A919UJE7_9MICO|nr:FKBP-type peptidyl-prolyl cis-trans isomerase [Demequina activiva]GIG53680.1 peptidylprolyl isomerase [Demequina activiva]
MKKTLPIVASAAAATLALAGCASGTAEGDPTTSPTTSPTGGVSAVSYDCAAIAEGGEGFGSDEDVAVLAGLEWCVGDDDSAKVQSPEPSSVSATATLVVDAGDGEAIEVGKAVTLDYTITSGADGTVLYSTYTEDAAETLILDETTLDPALLSAFTATSEGGEIVFASLDATAQDPAEATVYMAIRVTEVSAPLSAAEGEEVEPAAGLPVITIDEDGKPQVAFDGAEKPSELVVQPLITGDGDTLEEGDTAVVHYTGWVWDGEQFDSSWDRGAPASFPFVTGGLIDGWIQGLAGQTVGSRVLLVIPPELGYGEAGSGDAIPGDSTLVFVVDILAAL